MSNQLQHQLRDLSDQISVIVANKSRVRTLTTESVSVGKPVPDDTTCNAAGEQQWAERSVDAVDRDIAAVEKMLQQWLVARSTVKAPQFE